MALTQLMLQGGGMSTPLELDVEASGKLIDVVRDLAREGQLPLYWRCGQGTCGACLVYLSHAESGRTSVTLGGKERNVLVRLGKLPAEAGSTFVDNAELPRLACHVDLRPGSISVCW
jgi:hypothetical protein